MQRLVLVDAKKINKEDLKTSLFSLCDKDREYVLSFKQESDLILSLVSRLLERKFVGRVITRDGKPKAEKCFFNISHCYPYVVLYLSDETEVGVDIEKDKVLDDKVKDFILDKKEQKFVDNAHLVEAWTVKESALKLLGTGIKKKMNSLIIFPIKESVAKISNKLVFFKSFKKDNYSISICSYNDTSKVKLECLSIKDIF